MVILNNPCLGSCLLVVCKSNRGRYQFFYIQNHSSLTPLANDNILSKQIITNVTAYGLSLSHIFRIIQETQCEWNKNIFGERGLGNWLQEINTTKIAQNI
jgi:hypothetical protein